MKGFIHFIRTQGVVGLAVGFILGGAAQQLVASFSKDLFTPALGLALGRVGNLGTASSTVSGATFAWGNFIMSLINLLMIALVVYLAFRAFKLERLDTPKS